jgi:hypothetical protein
MADRLLWFAAGVVAMAFVLLAPRLARRHRNGLDVNAGRRYEWAKDGKL